MFTANYHIYTRNQWRKNTRLFIHASTFTSSSFPVNQNEALDTSPVIVTWASWGPQSTRFMSYTEEETSFGYNVGYAGTQLNFNSLDIARDLHRARSSTQEPQDGSPCLRTIFGRDSPTTVLADGIFEEDIQTHLPFRCWGAQAPGCLVVPAEDWIYLVK